MFLKYKIYNIPIFKSQYGFTTIHSNSRSLFGNKTTARMVVLGLYADNNARSWSTPCQPTSMALPRTSKLWMNSWSWSTQTRNSWLSLISQMLEVACCRQRKFAKLSMLSIQIVTCMLMVQWHGDVWIWIWLKWIAIGKQCKKTKLMPKFKSLHVDIQKLKKSLSTLPLFNKKLHNLIKCNFK